MGFVCQHGGTLQEGAEHPHILVTLEPRGSLSTHKPAGETVYPGVPELLMAIINETKPLSFPSCRYGSIKLNELAVNTSSFDNLPAREECK